MLCFQKLEKKIGFFRKKFEEDQVNIFLIFIIKSVL